MTLAVSDPTQLRDRVTLDLALRGLTLARADTGVRAERTSAGTRVTVDTAARGATFALTLTRS